MSPTFAIHRTMPSGPFRSWLLHFGRSAIPTEQLKQRCARSNGHERSNHGMTTGFSLSFGSALWGFFRRGPAAGGAERT